jgi:hypothetical protein
MSALADAIKRDILKDRPSAPASPTCFTCGRSFGQGDSRFCSAKCRATFDDGFPSCEAVSSPQPFDLPPRGDGFLITCKGCRREFVSRCLRCCSTECERQYRERQEIEAIVAEVGGELSAKRKCQQCGGDIPRYQGVGKARKEVRRDARFCSPRCRERAKAVRKATEAVSHRIEPQKPLFPQRFPIFPIAARKCFARCGGHPGADRMSITWN